jgi:hypothetical protein
LSEGAHDPRGGECAIQGARGMLVCLGWQVLVFGEKVDVADGHR